MASGGFAQALDFAQFIHLERHVMGSTMANDRTLDQRMQLVTSKAFVRAIDDWRRRQEDLPSRSEAVRRLVVKGLSTDSGRPANKRK